MSDITHNSTIQIDSTGFNLNLDLKGNTLTVNASGNSCLMALNRANINVINSVGDGLLIANTINAGSIALRAESYGTIMVNAPLTINAMSSNSYGIYTYAAGSVTVMDAEINATGIGVQAYGDWNNHTDASSISVTGNITTSSDIGAYAYSGGVVTITGDVVSSTTGVYSEGGTLSVTGDVTGNSVGAHAPGGTINVIGNVSANGDNSYGAYAVGGTITVAENVSANGDNSSGAHAFASGSVTVGGNVNATGTGCYGAYVLDHSSVKIDGVINATDYVNIGGVVLTADDTYKPTKLAGYYTYANASDLSNYVLVKNNAPSASNVAITGTTVVGETLMGEYDFNGTTESGSTFRWLKNSGTPQLIAQIHSTAGVSSNPPNPSIITLSEDAYVTLIYTYHYVNGGQLPGTIALQEVGGDETVFGPWTAVGSEGSGSPNAYWSVYPNVILPAGDYQVIDSHPATWSWAEDTWGDGTGGRGMVYVYADTFTPIAGATSKTYTLSSTEEGFMIKFEVTPQELAGISGSPVLSEAIGPVESQFIGNQAPVLTSDWKYSTLYFGQHYPFTISVTDYESTPNTRLYSSIDGATPNQAYNFADVPGTVSITLSPLEGVLSAGSHTLSYYATDTGGATSETLVLQFTVSGSLSDNAALSGILLTGIELAPDFDSATTSYTASVGNSVNNTSITAEPADDSATVTINGTVGTNGEVSLNVGSNIITVEVTAEDGVTTKNYTITINRAAASGSSGGGSYTPPSVVVTTYTTNDSTSNSITVNPNVSSGMVSASVSKAMVDALIDKAKETTGTGKGDLIEVIVNTPANTEKLIFNIPQPELAKIADETSANFGISSPFISIVFDGKAVDAISGSESGGTVSITATRIADMNGRPVYDLKVMNGSTQVSDFNGGHATVAIPYTLKTGENPNAVVVYYLSDDGKLIAVRGHYDSDLKAVVFKTTHFSKFVIGYNPVSFDDVAANAWYENAIEFIAARGITSGTGNNMFSPEAKLTRAQFVVLLMNAYQISTQNQGESSQIQNFSDAGNTYYTEYLLAAKMLGIVNGVGNNMFAPENEITRQEMFVMLYNALKFIDEVPAYVNNSQLSSFNDADKIAPWANEASSSLVKTGTIGGYNNNLYPTATTTRAEIAQVLYNLLSK